MLLLIKVAFQLVGECMLVDDTAVFKKNKAGGDVNGVLQVMRADNERGTCTLLVVSKYMFQLVLACRVKEIERLVKDN